MMYFVLAHHFELVIERTNLSMNPSISDHVGR
jgi:hypothetical protein